MKQATANHLPPVPRFGTLAGRSPDTDHAKSGLFSPHLSNVLRGWAIGVTRMVSRKVVSRHFDWDLVTGLVARFFNPVE